MKPMIKSACCKCGRKLEIPEDTHIPKSLISQVTCTQCYEIRRCGKEAHNNLKRASEHLKEARRLLKV